MFRLWMFCMSLVGQAALVFAVVDAMSYAHALLLVPVFITLVFVLTKFNMWFVNRFNVFAGF